MFLKHVNCFCFFSKERTLKYFFLRPGCFTHSCYLPLPWRALNLRPPRLTSQALRILESPFSMTRLLHLEELSAQCQTSRVWALPTLVLLSWLDISYFPKS